MKPGICLLAFLLIGNFLAAQSLTGVWRGYFNSGYGTYKQKYKYEVQINQLNNQANQKGVHGVTYSYHSTVFYGKATLQGIYDPKGQSITIKELKLIELKISDNSQPCLMTCYLDYRKEGKTEILEGTFTSIVEKTKADCGSGYVYLERVEESDFYKEDFLIKKSPSSKPPVAKVNPPAEKKQTETKPQQPVVKSAPPVAKKTTPQAIPQKNTAGSTSKNVQPKKPADNKITDTIAKTKAIKPPVISAPKDNEVVKKNVPVPNVIKERENPLIKKILTASPDILIQLYDNGEIDGDTITVYDNNEVIAHRKGLTGKPITLNIKADLNNAHHEFIMVANNLGTIPPNTALMIITTDGKRYELFLSADETKNAKVIIDYKMPSKDSK